MSLKAALDHPGWYAVTAVGFVVAFASLALTLQAGMGLGIAYGIWAALGVALTAIASRIPFKEPLNRVMAIGIVLIMGEVLSGNGRSSLSGRDQGVRRQHVA